MYPLDGMLLLSLIAVLAGAEGFTDIALFGREKLAFLYRFRPFKEGTPSHDQFGPLFASLDAEHFQCCFVAWAAALTGAPVKAVAIDGKTRRRSYQKKGAKDLLHLAGSLNPVEHISRHERFAFHRPFEGFRHGGIEAGDEAFDPLLKMFL